MDIFSIFDVTSAYSNIQLDERSQLLTMFNTIYGRYVSSGIHLVFPGCIPVVHGPGIQGHTQCSLYYR